MSEIVFTKTNTAVPRPTFDDEYSNRRAPADTKITIFQSYDKVAFVHSVLVVGLAKRGLDKKYYQWRTIGSLGFRTNSAGTVIPYEARRPWDFKVGTPWTHSIPITPFSFLDGLTGKYTANIGEESIAAFRQAVWATFGIKTMTDLYPIADKYGLISYRTIPYGLRMPMRSDNWDDYSTKAFGKTRVTPRLVAAVQQTDPYMVALAQQFRGYVTNDAIIEFMENNWFDEDMERGFEPHSPFIRSYIKNMSEATKTNILTGGIDLSDLRRIMVMNANRKSGRELIDSKRDYRSLSEIIPWVK